MKIHLVILTAILSLLGSVNFAAGQPAKVAIGYSGISADQLVIWVARDAGIFAKNNLDVQAVYFSGGTISVTAMIAAKYLRLEDKELLQRTYESSIEEKKLPAKQYPSVGGIKTILDELALKDPKAKAVKPQDFIDARFVEEFDKSGYIDGLYGKKK